MCWPSGNIFPEVHLKQVFIARRRHECCTHDTFEVVLCSWWSIRESGSGHVLRMRIYACFVAGNGITATRKGG